MKAEWDFLMAVLQLFTQQFHRYGKQMVCDFTGHVFLIFVPVLIICGEKQFIHSLLRDTALF